MGNQTASQSIGENDTCVPGWQGREGVWLQEMFAHFRTQLKWSGHKTIFEFALKTQQQQLWTDDVDMGPCL